MTVLEVLTVIRDSLIQASGLSGSAVTLNNPNRAEDKNFCIYAFGFPLQTLPKPMQKRVYVKIEYRENLKSTAGRQQDTMETCIDLAYRAMRKSIGTISLEPYQNAIEGRDEKVPDFYLIEWAYEVLY